MSGHGDRTEQDAHQRTFRHIQLGRAEMALPGSDALGRPVRAGCTPSNSVRNARIRLAYHQMRVIRTYTGVMDPDVAHRLEQSLDRFMLRRSQDELCNPVLAVAPPGVDRQTYPLLRTLVRLGPLPASRLAEEVGIDRSGVSRYADRLQADELLERRPDPRDGRSVLLCLTPAGAELVGHLREVLARHLDSIISSWPPGQAEALIAGLELLLVPSPVSGARVNAPADGHHLIS